MKDVALIEQATRLIRDGRPTEALAMLLPEAESSLAVRVHATLAALGAGEWSRALEFLPGLREQSEAVGQLEGGASDNRIPAHATLALLHARAMLGGLPIEILESFEGRAPVREALDVARTESTLRPLVDLLRLTDYLSEGRFPDSFLPSLDRLHAIRSWEGQGGRTSEAAGLSWLCASPNIGIHAPNLRGTANFFSERGTFDDFVATCRHAVHTRDLGGRWWWPAAWRISTRVLLKAWPQCGNAIVPVILRALRDSARRGHTVFVPEPDPEGRDWLALCRVASLFSLLPWRRTNLSQEFLFQASIKGEEVLALYRFVRERRPVRALQVGTFVGYSAALVALAMEDCCDEEATLHAVDPGFPLHGFEQPLDLAAQMIGALGPRVNRRVVLHRGWFATRGFALASDGERDPAPAWTRDIIGRRVLEDLDGPVDFAFIDGDHAHCAVMADTLTTLDYMAEGGIIALHDVNSWPGVGLALESMLADGVYFCPAGGTLGLSARADVGDTWPNRQEGLGVIRVRRSVYVPPNARH